MDRIQLLGVPIDNLTMGETLNIIKNAIDNKKHIHHTVVNAAKIVLMHRNPQLFESVCNADIINVDGGGVVIASKILGSPLKERVAGIDLMVETLTMAANNGYKVYLLGATDEVLTTLKSKITDTYGASVIAGSRNGYFKLEDEAEIVNDIKVSGANILYVAMPSPKKENFLYRNHDGLNETVNFMMGVGGSFDVLAGKVARAPKWMQATSLEWFYRMMQEPRRLFMRYLKGNSRFIWMVLKSKASSMMNPAA